MHNKKNHHIIFSWLVCLLLFVACGGEKESLYPYGWTKTGMPSDTTLLQLDNCMMNYGDPDSLASLVEKYCKQSLSEDKGNRYEHRRLYWQGNALFMKGDFERGDSLRRLAMEKCDSADFPRDYALYRMVNEQISDFQNNLQRYQRYKSDLKLFLKSEDPVSGFSRSIMLMTLMKEVGMKREALDYALCADSLLDKAGLTGLRESNRINVADCYFELGDTAAAIKELDLIRSGSGVYSTPAIAAIVEYNRYQISKDTLSLRKAWNIVNGNEGLIKFRALVAAEIVNNGNPLNLPEKTLIDTLNEADDYDYSPEEEMGIFKARADMACQTNDPLFSEKFSKYKESVDRFHDEMRKDELISVETAEKINQAKEEEIIKREELKVRFLVGVSVAVLIVSLVALLLYRKWMRMKELSMLERLEHERLGRENIAKDLVIVEKQKLNDELQSKLDSLVEAKRMEEKTACEIREILAITDSVKSMKMKEVDFLKRFMERYPDVGKTGRRLALYIRKGLDTTEIASEMNIRKESVMQARWRLRAQMSLPNDCDLDVEIQKL